MIAIPCICVDGKCHWCYPHKNESICGLKIIRKKLGKLDYLRFNCYECDTKLIEIQDKLDLS